MLGKIKALGLALVAVLAIGALGASGASATEFHSSAEVTEFSGTQEGVHDIVVNTGVIECEEEHFTGEVVGEEVEKDTFAMEALVLHPEYTECEFRELFEVEIVSHECDFVFHASSSSEGSMDIDNCYAAEPYIQIGSLTTCRVRIEEQEALALIDYAVLVEVFLIITFEIEEMTYSESGLFCTGGSVDNGTYDGNVWMIGKGEGKTAYLSIS